MARRLSTIPTVHPTARLTATNLGAYTEVGEQCYLENVEMGDYSYCGQLCYFQNVTVGKFSSIAAAVRIGPTMHPTDRPTQHHFTYRRALYGLADHDDHAFFAWRASQRSTVGHDTWIGHAAIIMPNRTVGTGAIIGAGAVVTKDIPPYAVAVGVPARVIRQRFSAETAEALQAIAWWNWHHELIAERLEDFSLPVDAFVEKHRKH